MRGHSVPFAQVDAFANQPFTGNPAAVLILERPLSDSAMQRIAAEMNLSETAFTGLGPEGHRWLRWFTPAVEVPLCGHATLATAHVLFEAGEDGPLRFDSASGALTVHREAGRRIRLDFPADLPAEAPAPQGLLAALGCPADSPTLLARNLWIVRVPTTDVLSALAPRYSALREIDVDGRLGVAVTAPGDDADFASRFFAPWVGVDEDPVTGVAHTALAPYWTTELGPRPMEARQISARGGELTVAVRGDRVHLIGSAVTVAQGLILVPGA